MTDRVLFKIFRKGNQNIQDNQNIEYQRSLVCHSWLVASRGGGGREREEKQYLVVCVCMYGFCKQ